MEPGKEARWKFTTYGPVEYLILEVGDIAPVKDDFLSAEVATNARASEDCKDFHIFSLFASSRKAGRRKYYMPDQDTCAALEKLADKRWGDFQLSLKHRRERAARLREILKKSNVLRRSKNLVAFYINGIANYGDIFVAIEALGEHVKQRLSESWKLSFLKFKEEKGGDETVVLYVDGTHTFAGE